jgi:hypothetical protein
MIEFKTFSIFALKKDGIWDLLEAEVYEGELCEVILEYQWLMGNDVLLQVVEEQANEKA